MSFSRFRFPISDYVISPLIVADEFNSNGETIFSFWDRLPKIRRMDIPQDAVDIGVPVRKTSLPEEHDVLLGQTTIVFEQS